MFFTRSFLAKKIVNAIFDFYETVGAILILIKTKLLREYEHNCLPSASQNFYKTMIGIESLEMNDEQKQFVLIIRKNKEVLKTVNYFLTYDSKNNNWKCLQLV